MADPTSNKNVSQGCMRRMRRESMYGEENVKPVPVVQILRWQGASKEWVVIDLVPETSEPSQSADKRSPSKKSYQEKTKNGSKKSEDISSEPSQSDDRRSPSKRPHQEKLKNSCKKQEGISSERRQSEKMSSAMKTDQEKEVVKKSCKKPDSIKTCFFFDWKEKVLAVPKCIKVNNGDENPTVEAKKKANDNENCVNKVNDNENPTVQAKNKRISSGDRSSKQSKDISRDHRNLSHEEPTREFENIPTLPPEISQTCRKTNNKNSNISFNPDGRQECGITKGNSNIKGNCSKNSSKPFYKAPTIRDVEAEKVLKAAILVAEATIKTVEEMKAAKKCDIVGKTMGYKTDVANEQRPVWKTAAPNTKFQMSKQVDNNNSARVTPDQQTKTSGESNNTQATFKQLQKSSRQCEKTLKRSEAEKEYILGLLNNLIYKVAKKKATKEEEALDDKSLREAFGNDELLFADEEKENEEEAEKEKSAADCAMKTLEEVNGFETSRSWY